MKKFTKLKIKFLTITFVAILLCLPKVFAKDVTLQEVENNNSKNKANVISLFDNVSGKLSYHDIDRFKINIPKLRSYEISAKSSKNIKLEILVENEFGQVVNAGIANEDNKILLSNMYIPGEYYITIIKKEEGKELNTNYNFKVYPLTNSNEGTTLRINGKNRYETSLNISKEGWRESSYAVIATGADFPDALSSAPLAKKYNAPILLTDSKNLDVKTKEELKRLKTKNVFIIGGEGAVSKEVEKQIAHMGIKCKRLYGKNRYETSIAIAKQLNPKGEAVVATGADFPDALSIASYAAFKEMPIILVEKDYVSKDALDYIKSNNIDKTYIVGGKGVISEKVENMLPSTERISGANRYATNIKILYRFSNEMDNSKTYFATGANFPDALSGAALASITKSPIILTSYPAEFNSKDYIIRNIHKIKTKCIIGGTGVVPNKSIDFLFN